MEDIGMSDSTHRNRLWHTYAEAMAHIGMSHGTHRNESWHTCAVCLSLSARCVMRHAHHKHTHTHTITHTYTHTHAHTHETYIHEKRLITQPCLPQKSPIYLPKSPTYSQKSHVCPHKSPDCLSLSAALTIANGCSQNRTDDLNVLCVAGGGFMLRVVSSRCRW